MNGCFHRGEIYHILPEDNETGSEQYSGRPAIIVSNEANNKFAHSGGCLPDHQAEEGSAHAR